MSPGLVRLRALGLLEGVSTLVLFGIAMPLKYVWDMPLAVRIVGSVHGALFIAFCLGAVIVAAHRRWPVVRPLLLIVAAIVPFGPFVMDRRLRSWDR
ncbi:MAG: DUF3817 domain-containing protein [Planctomycetes bacterium]|nr:DUF3817 domain-containing protein [Planctomycetota bacterium]